MSIKKLARKLWTGRSSREVQQSLFRRRPLFEALERRYLMSAELVPPPPQPASDEAPIVAPAHPGQASPQAKKPQAPGAHPYLVERAAFHKQGVLGEQISLDQYAKANAARQGDAKAWLPGHEAAAPLTALEGYTTQSERTPVRQIIFVDPSIENAEEMVQGLYSLVSGKTEGLGGLATPTGDGPQLQVLRSHDTEIIVLDGRYDGVDQITQILAQHKDLAAVQIMSHGGVGSLTLGTATLGEGQLDAYKDQLRAWGDAMSEDGDILLYGCNVAAGRGGVAFVDSLSAITRADVAAATHSVGSAALGGDWVLDYRHGAIEATTLTVARWDGLMATSTGVQTGGSTLTGVATNDTLVAYGSDNTFVFDNNSTAATTTIELRQGMKQDNGVWVRNEDDENSNNTLDFSAIKGNVTAIISNNDSYQIRYTTVDANDNWTEHTVNVVFKSADGSQSLKIGDKTFNLVGTSQSGKTLLDYSGYATGVTVDLSGPTADSNGEEVPPPPPTGFGYVRAISAVKGSTQGGNRITVVGDTTVTISNAQDIITGSGGGNTYIVGAGIRGFTLTQQAGQSGNTLDLSQFGADVTARVQTQGGVTVYMGAGVAADGSVSNFAGATALVSNLDIQIFIGVAGKTTLDYSAYEDNVTVNLNYQDEATALYDASGLAGVLNISNVIGAGGSYGNDIVGSLGDNIITVANSRGANRISGGGGNDIVYGNGSLGGGATEYIAGVESDATLTGDTVTAVLSNTPPGATSANTVRLYGVSAVTLQDYRTIDGAAAAGSAYHPDTVVTLDGSGYAGDLTLIGSAGANVLRGGLGHNVFTGYQGSNVLVAQAGSLSNTLSEDGNWNFTLSDSELIAQYASDGDALPAGAATPVLHNVLQGGFSDARLNGGLGSTLIDASAFSGNTVLVSGLMAGGAIKAGGGDRTQHQVILMGGQYAVTGGTGAGATTELVVVADGLTGIDPAQWLAQQQATGGLGWVSFVSDGLGTQAGKILRAEGATTGSTYNHVTSARVIGGEYGNWIDTSAFEGRAVLDGSAGLSNIYVLSNRYDSDVIGSAGENTIRVDTGGKNLRLIDGQMDIGVGTGAVKTTFSHVNQFDLKVSGSGSQVDTTGFTGLTTQTFLADLTSGYQDNSGPALKFVFANDDRLEVSLEGMNTLQDILNAIAGSVMVDKSGQPIRIAAEGPNAGRPLPDSDTTTAWDYLYALDARLNADGCLVVSYTQAARDAGYGGDFRLEPGTLITLDDQGNVSQSTTVLSEAAKWLGLLGASESFRASVNGVLTGDALAAAHSTRFMLAGSNAVIRSGGGENTFLVSYGFVADDAWERFSTGAGNSILTHASGYNTLRVDSVYGAILTPTQVSYLNGATFASVVTLARAGGGTAMDNVTLAARNAGGTATTLDAEAWTGRTTLESDGGYNTLKGNKSNVSFIVVQPVNTAGGSVTVSLAAAGGSGNSLQLISPVTGTAVLSSLMGAAGNLLGVNLGANAQNLEKILDLGENAVIDVDVTSSGTDVTIRAGTLKIEKSITLDSTHLLRLEAQDIQIGSATGAHIVLAAGAIEVLAQRYRPWRSAYGQIFDLSTSLTITNATLWATKADGAGVTISAKLDSSQYDLDPLVKNAEADTGLRAKLGGGVNSAYDA